MARFARVVVVDVPHHVTQRGNARQVILGHDADRITYLGLLRQYSELHGLALLGYCLMSNHVHLIAIPHTADGLAQALKQAHGRYAAYWNARQWSSGHVWQGRFYSCPLDDSHLWEAMGAGPSFANQDSLLGCPTLPALFAGGWALATSATPIRSRPPRCPLRFDLDNPFRPRRIVNKTTPFPVLWPLHQSSLYRIAMDVPQVLDAFRFAPNRKIVIADLRSRRDGATPNWEFDGKARLGSGPLFLAHVLLPLHHDSSQDPVDSRLVPRAFGLEPVHHFHIHAQ